MSSLLAIINITAKYTIPPAIIATNIIGRDVMRNWVDIRNPPITRAARNCRATGLINENATYRRAMKKTNTDVIEIINDASATPLYPYHLTNKGVRIHVRVVHPTIKYSVTFTFPIALRKFVSGVDMDEKTVLSAKKDRERIAGSHF